MHFKIDSLLPHFRIHLKMNQFLLTQYHFGIFLELFTTSEALSNEQFILLLLSTDMQLARQHILSFAHKNASHKCFKTYEQQNKQGYQMVCYALAQR